MRQESMPAPYPADNFHHLLVMGKELISTGFLPPSIKTPAQAVAIILSGREYGLPEMISLREIQVIQGKPTLSSKLKLAIAKQKIPGLQAVPVKETAEECQVEFSRPDHKPYVCTFTMKEAMDLGLATKDNYSKQPATMLYWRCIDKGLRRYCPELILPYSKEELIPVVESISDLPIDRIKPSIVTGEEARAGSTTQLSAPEQVPVNCAPSTGTTATGPAPEASSLSAPEDPEFERLLTKMLNFFEANGYTIKDLEAQRGKSMDQFTMEDINFFRLEALSLPQRATGTKKQSPKKMAALMGAARVAGMEESDVRAMLKDKFGSEHLNEMSDAQYDDALGEIYALTEAQLKELEGE